MSGIGGTNMDSKGIDYRERSPLVVPPRIDLPPPVTASREVKIPNWPKDPDEARRKAAIEARKKSKPATPTEAATSADAERTQRRPDRRSQRSFQQRFPDAGRDGGQSDAEPVAARLYRRHVQDFPRQHGRSRAVQRRADAGNR